MCHNFHLFALSLFFSHHAFLPVGIVARICVTFNYLTIVWHYSCNCSITSNPLCFHFYPTRFFLFSVSNFAFAPVCACFRRSPSCRVFRYLKAPSSRQVCVFLACLWRREEGGEVKRGGVRL
jgi:hypothetical protein